MSPQAICNDIYRQTILDIASQNGGLKKIAEKAKINYSALWNMLNRNAGVLVHAVPKIVNGTKDIKLLHQICNPCGYMPVENVKFKRGVKSVRKREVDLSITLGRALKIIEQSYEDKKITKQEYKKIHFALNELRRKEAELDLRIKKEVKA